MKNKCRIPIIFLTAIFMLPNIAANVDKKAKALSDEFHNLEKRYTTYSEIVKTYYEISQGDYISKFVEQERQRQEK